MKQYKIEIFRVKRSGEQPLIVMEFDRERFTGREYKDYLISTLFELACEGIENKLITARLSCDGKKVLTVYCDTKVDGANITAYLRAARPREVFRLIRTMRIAC